jgi:UDP-N-acetylglucosamine 2-epimerase (non-hydrolysing)
MTTILSVVGARPNFMKLAPLARALASRRGTRHVIVHTGQHYDPEMSDAFFADLRIPAPDHNLDVGSGSHAQQTGVIMQRFEPVLLAERPDLVLVYGDVNSTVAAALVAAKLGVKVGHVEAGVRSRDWSMPEEVNRVVTDRLADLLFTPSRDAADTLRHEGIAAERIHFVGNVMIDELVRRLPAARALRAPGQYGVEGRRYALATLHRAGNVDVPERLAELVRGLERVARELPVLFPVHPRTRQRMSAAGLEPGGGKVRLLDPLGYLEMLGLMAEAALVITDSGGVQTETSYLGVPCITARPNTEWTVTLTEGTNQLVEPSSDAIADAARARLATGPSERARVERWDGKAAERIVGVVLDGEEYR